MNKNLIYLRKLCKKYKNIYVNQYNDSPYDMYENYSINLYKNNDQFYTFFLWVHIIEDKYFAINLSQREQIIIPIVCGKIIDLNIELIKALKIIESISKRSNDMNEYSYFKALITSINSFKKNKLKDEELKIIIKDFFDNYNMKNINDHFTYSESIITSKQKDLILVNDRNFLINVVFIEGFNPEAEDYIIFQLFQLAIGG